MVFRVVIPIQGAWADFHFEYIDLFQDFINTSNVGLKELLINIKDSLKIFMSRASGKCLSFYLLKLENNLNSELREVQEYAITSVSMCSRNWKKSIYKGR